VSAISSNKSQLPNQLSQVKSTDYAHGTWWHIGWVDTFQTPMQYPCCIRERSWV